jgi:CheY-like chemotaxis protein
MTSLKGRKILVADDEPMLREILKDVLEFEGAVVKEASNGKEAFSQLLSNPIEAVVSDIRMPGGDGLELLEKLRERNFETPVVLLITGFSDLSHDAAYSKGADAVFSKPFDVNELTDRLRSLLTGFRERLSHPVPVPAGSGISRSERGVVTIGRGGMFVGGFSEEFVGAVVSFDLAPSELGQRVRGTGVVRWVRKVAQGECSEGSGVEFLHLEPESLDAVAEFLSRNPRRAFIPDR